MTMGAFELRRGTGAGAMAAGAGPDAATVQATGRLMQAVLEQAGQVVLGKEPAIRLALACLLARGHLLIEDIPGVGKTTLAHVLARTLGLDFQRVQFTSDLLPADILGISVYDQARGGFEFHPGPVFSQLVLADEVNRATPKTQSALLEAMNDRQVSVDRVSHHLPEPFMLLATQNPLEFSGTFVLPESQLDRFTMCLRIGYPDPEHEREVIRMTPSARTIEDLSPVINIKDLCAMQALAERVRVDDDLVSYIIAIVTGTRNHRDIRLGVSPRATTTLYRTARAHAVACGRDYCLPDDIKALCVPVFAHRIIPEEQGFNGVERNAALIEDVLSNVSVPV